MFGFIERHQLNIMLALCSVCAFMAVLLLFTKFLPKRRKWTLILMELIAASLLGFDRAAYTFKGDTSHIGDIMVRLSNFMVFFLTSAIILGFNLYLTDLLQTKTQTAGIPRRLKAVNIGSVAGMALVILSQFTGLYYTIDANNIYHRGSGFLISYIIPIVFPILQFTVIRQYRRYFSKLIYFSLVLYIFVPIIVGIIQIFTYGLSLVNMAMVLVSVSLYIFTYLDINDEVVRAHEIEVVDLQNEQQSMKRLFDQTVNAFVTAAEKRDPDSEGHSVRVAECAGRIAAAAGKSDEECEKVYYAALLHDIGIMGIPDSVIQKTEGFTENELKQSRRKPVLSAEILSSITEYPYLSEGTRYTHEKYDGTGYPEGLKGGDIPEISRIIAVADAYVSMTTQKHSQAPRSYQVVREEFIKQAGLRFDPTFAEIMVQLMDEDRLSRKVPPASQTETELCCTDYRDSVSTGIPVKQEETKISFLYEPSVSAESSFSAPSVVIFASYDKRVHNEVKTVEAYNYLEYAELWFDGHYVSTNARKTEVRVTKKDAPASGTAAVYELTAGRYEDHLCIHMESPSCSVDVTMAIPDISREAYIGLTGENCRIRKISIQQTGVRFDARTIRRIIGKISYIDRLEADLPNVQIDHARSAYTDCVDVSSEFFIDFHTMSLPSANLVWHCPYILLFYSDDKRIGGQGYREYALIKINGEVTGNGNYAENTISMKKSADFPGWEVWKSRNKKGLECSVKLVKKGSRIIVTTENLGISVNNTTIIKDGNSTVYAALTGNRVALTDIRIR